MRIRNIVNTNFVKNNVVKNRHLPLMTTPLVCYYIGQYQDENVEAILKFFKSKSITIPSNLEPHSLTKTGWNPSSQTKIKKELDKALKNGDITQDEHTKYYSKVNFTSAPEDGIDDSILESDPELAQDLRELQSIDTSLSPELQDYRDLPDFDTPRELLEYFIGDKLPDDVILDWDFWSVLETIWEELLDIGDWF